MTIRFFFEAIYKLDISRFFFFVTDTIGMIAWFWLTLTLYLTEAIAPPPEHRGQKHCKQEWHPTAGHLLHAAPVYRRPHI